MTLIPLSTNECNGNEDGAIEIQIDGGVNTSNARKLVDCGADILVAGSFVFKSDNPIETISNLKNI